MNASSLSHRWGQLVRKLRSFKLRASRLNKLILMEFALVVSFLPHHFLQNDENNAMAWQFPGESSQNEKEAAIMLVWCSNLLILLVAYLWLHGPMIG